MTSLNIQKLVVVFLVFAVLAGSGIFAFSAYQDRPSAFKSEKAGGGKSAFVEKLPSGSQDAEWEAANAASRDNATNQVAELIAKSVIAKNPEGPQTDETGSSIILPKETGLIIENYFGANPPSPDILNPRIDITKIKFTADTSENNRKYFIALSDLNNASDLAAESRNLSEEETIGFYNDNLYSHSSKLAKIEVPVSLYKFHKAVLELYAPLSSYAKLLNEDPVTAAALETSFKQNLAKKLSAFDEASKQLEKVSVLPASGPESFLAEIFGIKTAYATVPTIDYVAIVIAIKDFVVQYWEIIEKAAIGYAKNRLLREITRQVVKWALGEGTPQFVTNWQGFLQDATNQGLGEVIESVAPALCGSASGIGAWTGLGNIADFLNRIMSPIDTYDYSSRTSCTLDRVVQNIEDFGKDLRNGGWLGYSALLEPQNTLFGSVITIADLQLQKATEAKEAALQKAIAGGGYTGTEICDNGQKPKLIARTKQYSSLNGDTTTGAPVLQCEDGSTPRVTTPGVNTAGIVTKSFDSAYDRLVNANDYTALLTFLVDAYINKLVTSGAKGIAGSEGGGRGAPVIPGTTDAERAQQILDIKRAALGEARRTQDTLGQTLQILQQVVNTCTANESVTVQASGYATTVITARDELAIKISELRTAVTALEAMVNGKNYSGLAAYGSVQAAVGERDGIFAKGEIADQLFLDAQTMYSSCIVDVLSTPTPTSTATSTSTSTDDGLGGETP